MFSFLFESFWQIYHRRRSLVGPCRGEVDLAVGELSGERQNSVPNLMRKQLEATRSKWWQLVPDLNTCYTCSWASQTHLTCEIFRRYMHVTPYLIIFVFLRGCFLSRLWLSRFLVCLRVFEVYIRVLGLTGGSWPFPIVSSCISGYLWVRYLDVSISFQGHAGARTECRSTWSSTCSSSMPCSMPEGFQLVMGYPIAGWFLWTGTAHLQMGWLTLLGGSHGS